MLLPALGSSSQDLESLNSLVVSREPSKVRTLPQTVLPNLVAHGDSNQSGAKVRQRAGLKAGYNQQPRGPEGGVLCACALKATELPLIASAQSDPESAHSA